MNFLWSPSYGKTMKASLGYRSDRIFSFVSVSGHNIVHGMLIILGLHPHATSHVPLFQNESKCEIFHLKLSSAYSFIFMQIKVIFHKNSFALRLIWKQRHKETWKWPTKVRMCYVALNFFAVIVFLELYLLLLLSVVIQMDKFLGCTVFCCCHFCLHSVLKMSLK